jgi:GTP-binding nuclear protein Ran
MITTFKVCILGNARVGKSTFIKRHITGEYDKNYIPTIGVEVHPLVFHTTRGIIKLNLWDCAGEPRYCGLGDSYYFKADAALLLFSLDIRKSYDDLNKWYQAFNRVAPNVPICVMGNKYDLAENYISNLTFHSSESEMFKNFYYTSGKTNYNFEKPFLCLLRNLMKDDTLQFTPASITGESFTQTTPPSSITGPTGSTGKSSMVTRSQKRLCKD